MPAHSPCSTPPQHDTTGALGGIDTTAATAAPLLGQAPAEAPQQASSSSMQAASEHQHASMGVASNGCASDQRMGPASADEPAEDGDQAQSRPGEQQQNAEPKHAAEEGEDKDQADRRGWKQKQASKPDRKPARNRACPCKSGRRYKDCCGPIQAAVERRATHGAQTPDTSQGRERCVSQLYI